MGEWTEEIVLAVVAAGGAALLDYLFDLYRQRFEIPADERELAAPAVPVERKWDYVAIAIGAVLFVLSGWAIFAALTGANRWWAMRGGAGRFLLLPQDAMWFTYSFFAAMFTGILVAIALMRLVLGRERWQDWRRGHQLAAGFRSWDFVRRIALWVMVPFTIFLAPAVLIHSRVDERGITTQGYGEWRPRVLRFSEAKKLWAVDGVIAPIGSYRERPHLVVEFASGARWTSEDGVRVDEPPPVGLAAFLAARTGLAPARVKTLAAAGR